MVIVFSSRKGFHTGATRGAADRPADAASRSKSEAPADAGAENAWDLELATPTPWAAAPTGDLAPLTRIPVHNGFPAPDPALHLWAVRTVHGLSGGLLVRLESEDASGVQRLLAEAPFAERLGFLLDAWALEAEVRELRMFREAVATGLPYGILAIDALGRVAYAGGRASAILGLPDAEMVGSDCARVFRPVGLQVNPLVDGLRRRQEPMELYIARPDGREVPVSLQTTRIAGVPPRPRSLVAFFQDLSEEQAFEEAERQRDRLAVLGELSAGVAHEIRNPLTGIANCAQVLAEGMDEQDRRQRFLKIILDEAARLNRIVEGLLHYARPNRPEMRETALEEVVRRSLEVVRPECEGQGVRLRLRMVGRIPKVYVDPSQIEQVLLNLLRNAREAMPSGGEIEVHLSVIRRRPHRRRGTGRRATDKYQMRSGATPLVRFVQIRVGDTGHGIPKEILPRVSNPFFTTRNKGTGLGLSLSHSIVREHGGFLTIRSVEQKGTTVEIDLPVERRQGERRKESRAV